MISIKSLLNSWSTFIAFFLILYSTILTFILPTSLICTFCTTVKLLSFACFVSLCAGYKQGYFEVDLYQLHGEEERGESLV
jgi:hypothetical protein